MKKIAIALLFVLLIAPAARAKMYIIYDGETKEVHTMSPKNDTLPPPGHMLKELPGGWSNYDFGERNPCDYKYVNDGFVLDVAKISNQELEAQAAQEIATELEMIEKKMKLLAMKELKKEGKPFKKIKESDFE